MSNFIGEYQINEKVCKRLVQLFDNHPELHQAGSFVRDDGSSFIDRNIKESYDMSMEQFCDHKLLHEYMSELQKCLENYVQDYPELEEAPRFKPTYFHIQMYESGQGYKAWHCERSAQTYNRCLVYMTYLNDVMDGGMTEFKYQDVKVQPKIGKTLIWPSDWTHTHRGFSSNNKDERKYIATGWYNTSPDLIKII